MNKILLSIVGIIILLVGGFYAFNSYVYNEKQGDKKNVTSYRGTLIGEQICLPYTDTSMASPTDCALGMKTDVGEYYVLNFALLSQNPSPGLKIGDRFSATGLITPIEMLSTDHWKKYPVEGIFSVTDSVEKL